MKDEIKEILDKLKKLCYDDYCLEFSVDYIDRKEEKLLLDYITNLQETIKKKDDGIKALTDELCEYAQKEERLLLIIKAIKQQCDVTENYEMNEFIRQLENEPVDSEWLKRVAGDE